MVWCSQGVADDEREKNGFRWSPTSSGARHRGKVIRKITCLNSSVRQIVAISWRLELNSPPQAACWVAVRCRARRCGQSCVIRRRDGGQAREVRLCSCPKQVARCRGHPVMLVTFGKQEVEVEQPRIGGMACFVPPEHPRWVGSFRHF